MADPPLAFFLLADLEKADTRYCCYILVLMLIDLSVSAVFYGHVLLIELIKLTNMDHVQNHGVLTIEFKPGQ